MPLEMPNPPNLIPRCVLRTIAACVMFASSGLAAKEKRPIGFEDVWQMRRFGQPAVSPDGRWVVVPVAEPSFNPKDDNVDLWLVSLAGNFAPQHLTRSTLPEAGAGWNRDSERIVFYYRAASELVPQVYELDIRRGRLEQMTDSPGGAILPKWSPDGRTIAFVSEVYPGAKNDEENRAAAKAERERKTSARVYDTFPVRYWDHWLDGRKLHLFVQPARRGAKSRDLFADWNLARTPGFSGRMTDTAEVFDFAWAPDGKSILFSVSLNRDRSAHELMTSDLFVVKLDGSEPQRLTDDDWSYSEPVFSPDGKWFVVGALPMDGGHIYTEPKLLRFPWPFDKSRGVQLAGGFDRSPGAPWISPDGSEVYFTAEDAGHERVFSAPAGGGPASLWLDPVKGGVSGLSVGGRREPVIVGIVDAADRPPELAVLSQGRGASPVTQFNRNRARNLDLQPLEEFWFTSSKGRRIHNFIVKPAGFDPSRKYPVFVMIHGGPNSMFRDSFGVHWNYHLFAGTDYVVLLTNYSGSSGFGEAFAQEIQGDVLKTPGEEIVEALDEAVARFPFMDGTRVAAGGASYGGHLTNWLQATTTRFRCFVNHAGMVNVAAQWGTSDVIYQREVNMEGPVWEQGEIWTSQNPARFADRHATGEGWVTPMLVSAGQQDFRVPLNNSLETWAYLKRLDIPSRLIVFPDEGHAISKAENSRFWYSEVRAWIDHWTLPTDKPAE